MSDPTNNMGINVWCDRKLVMHTYFANRKLQKKSKVEKKRCNYHVQ